MIEFALDQRYDKSQFMAFLKTFLPDDYVQQDIEVDINFTSNHITEASSLGTCSSIDLEVYEIHHTSLNDARVGLSKDAFRLLLDQSFHNRALVVFIPEEGAQWRLSLLQMEAEVSDHSSRITRNYSNPRRYSFLLGEGAHTKTPHQFLFEKGQIRERKEGTKKLTLWDDLLSRFSVEVLTKNFYNELFDWYTWAVDPKTGVYFPNNPNTTDDDRDNIDVKIIRLITRLMFVWFIKQKNLVPKQIFEAEHIRSILKSFNPMSEDDGVYYNAILQNLFFASLNRPVIDDEGKTRDFRSNYSPNEKQPSNLFRYDDEFSISQAEILNLFSHVPYLNAGLFECLDKTKTMDGVDAVYYDGFSSNKSKFKNGRYRQRAFIPNNLFFAKDKGIIDILSKYNFTVEENTPTEQQVALDPELLGKVFENLLGAYNPETHDTARNATGSFYTPREIVQYMVDESLIEHLKLHVGNELEPEFRKLVSYNEEEFTFTEEQRENILKAIYNCKVLDPACGSGAFPMGMLQQMVHIISRVDPENTRWKDIVLDRAIEDSKDAFKSGTKEERQEKLKQIEDTFENAIANPDYTRKLYLIENCIYGVDIQPIAMMISKLRFFISLICEQENINPDDPEHNFGVNTLPNLETKFVAANTLYDADIRSYSDDWTNDEHLKKLKDELLAIRHRHFYAQKRSQKRRILAEDEAKRKEISDYIITSTSKPDDEIIARDKALIKKHFTELDQYREKKIEEVEQPADLFGNIKKITIDVNAAKRRELMDRIKACEDEIKREENKKNPNGFETAVEQVTRWNPYDQNASSPFFDIEWMFGVNEKFDIIIANPPYGYIFNKNEFPYLLKKFDTAEYKIDAYSVFIERGFELIKKKGISTMITPYTFVSGVYFSKLRDFISKTNISKLILLGKKIFDAAEVDTAISFIRKDIELFSIDFADLREIENANKLMYVSYESIIYNKCFAIPNNVLVLGKNIEIDLYLKLYYESSTKLSSHLEFYHGIQTRGNNKALADINTPGTLPIIKGADFNRYILPKPQNGIFFCKNNIKSGGETQKYTTKEKIVMRTTADGIIASLDTNKLYALNSVNIANVISENYNVYSLLAILNSKLVDFYYRLSVQEKNKTFAEVKIVYLERIPLAKYNKKICNKIEKLVKSIFYLNGDEKNNVDRKIDLLVYKLYNLSYNEVLIIDPTETITISEYDDILNY